MATTAALAALPVGLAAAHDDPTPPGHRNPPGVRRGQRGRDDDDDDDDRDRGGVGDRRFTANFCRVGPDPLTSGDIRVEREGRIRLRLRGAMPNTAYELILVLFPGLGRENFGAVTTDSRGRFDGAAPLAFTGVDRAGVFVLTRAGVDQFASCIGT